MRLHVVGSGSKGNCYLIEDNGRYLALDAGMPFKEVQKACGFNVYQIDALLLSHMHFDHCYAVNDFGKYGIDCFSGRAQADSIASPISVIQEKKAYMVHGWKVIAISVPHNQTPNLAFLIESPEEHHKLLYLTDFEFLPFVVRDFSINTWLIEVNHMDAVEELEGSENYEHVLRGHSSIGTVKDIIKINQSDATKNIIACHLSDRNSDEKQIIGDLSAIVPDTVHIDIATKGKVIDL